MNTVKYRFKQIQKLGKLFGESHLTNIYISNNAKDGTNIKLSKTNYNQEVEVYTSYHKEDNILYIKNNVFREGKLVCRFIDYPCSVYFSKIKIYNKCLFKKYRNNILMYNILENNTVYFAY